MREAHAYPGCVKAIDEFLADNPAELRRGNFGKYYAIKR